MKRTLILLFGIMVALGAFSQGVPIIDAAMSIEKSSELATNINKLKENKSKLDLMKKNLEYIEKVNSAVRNVKTYKDICTRQKRITDNCIDILSEGKELNVSYADKLSMSILTLTENSTSLILLTETILKSDLRMNDAERIKHLNKCLEKTRKCEAQLRQIRMMLSYTRQIKQNCESIKKFK